MDGSPVGPRARVLRPAERLRLSLMGAVILALNAGGWAIYIFTVMPNHLHYAKLGVGLGVAITAWTLGLRHAYDADHI